MGSVNLVKQNYPIKQLKLKKYLERNNNFNGVKISISGINYWAWLLWIYKIAN